MAPTTLQVGYAGSHLPSYYAREHNVFERSVADLERLGRELGFDLHAIRDPVVSAEDARRASRELDAAGADLVLLQNSSFAMGDVVTEFADGRAHLGLWGMEEPTREGPIRLNTFVSLNLNAGVLTSFLADRHLPFKWFWGEVSNPWMGPRLAVTVRALRAAKRLASARIGWIGGLAPTFVNLAFDERKVAARLGVRVHPHELAEVVERTRRVSKAAGREAAATLAASARRVEVATEHLERGGALYVALRELAGEHGYDALAISCWPQFQTDLGIAPCWTNACLHERDGLPVASEGDVLGAVTMLMLNEVNRDRSMLLDISDADHELGALLMWHCGNSPARFADDAGVVLTNHPTLGRKNTGQGPAGVVGDQTFRPQPVTVTRIGADASQLLALEADVVPGRSRGFDGSRGWVANFRLNGDPIPLEDLVNTILVEGLEHHFIVGRGHHAPALLELAAWTGLCPVERVPYRDHLQLGSRAHGRHT